MQVEVLCSESSQPLELYASLGDQPLQLSMPSIAGGANQEGFTPPTVQLNLAACLQASAAAAVDSTEPDTAAEEGGDGSSASATAAQEQQQQAAVLASSSSTGSCVSQLLAGGNCQFELLGEGSSLLLKVEGKPVGACQRNACRAISLLLCLPKCQSSVTAG
jgi:hypothetical protein